MAGMRLERESKLYNSFDATWAIKTNWKEYVIDMYWLYVFLIVNMQEKIILNTCRLI